MRQKNYWIYSGALIIILGITLFNDLLVLKVTLLSLGILVVLVGLLKKDP